MTVQLCMCVNVANRMFTKPLCTITRLTTVVSSRSSRVRTVITRPGREATSKNTLLTFMEALRRNKRMLCLSMEVERT